MSGMPIEGANGYGINADSLGQVLADRKSVV